jgi:uncharacterized protein (DUF934 family)
MPRIWSCRTSARQDLYAVWTALHEAGLGEANLDLVTDIIACPGLDYCSLANARSIPLAQKLSERFADPARQRDLGELKIKISGCINACGHHHAGNIGILGVDRKGSESYQLLLGGSGDEDTTQAKIAGPGFDEAGIVDAIERAVEQYRTIREPASASSTPTAASAWMASRRRSMGDLLRFRDDPVPDEPAVSLDAFLDQTNAASVRIEAGDDVRRLAPVLERVRLVEVDFPRFRDGRGFSSARVLREMGYTGEIKATGDVLVDLVFFMRRCGFDSFAPNLPFNDADVQAALTRYPYVYQDAADPRPWLPSGACATRNVEWLAARSTSSTTGPSFHLRPTPTRSTARSSGWTPATLLRELFARRASLGPLSRGLRRSAPRARCCCTTSAQADRHAGDLRRHAARCSRDARLSARTSTRRFRLVQFLGRAARSGGARGQGRERPALVVGPRRLLRDPQGRAAQARQAGPRRVDQRPQGVPVGHPAEPAALRDRGRQAQDQPARRLDQAGPRGLLREHDLPRHPLEAQGYLSVGCQPCTSIVAPGEDPRAGRWRGWDKTECGIHGPAGAPGGDEGELPPGYEPAF